MNLDAPPFSSFHNDGLELAYFDDGDPAGDPILLIHGFASSASVNWIYPGWLRTLGDAGYRVIAIDNRGHGASAKPHDPEAYHPTSMAGDAAALLTHLGIADAHVMGYSMGARISAFLALEHPERVRSLVLGGLGIGSYGILLLIILMYLVLGCIMDAMAMVSGVAKNCTRSPNTSRTARPRPGTRARAEG